MSTIGKGEKGKHFGDLLVLEYVTLTEFDLGANLVLDRHDERMSCPRNLTKWLKSTKAIPSTRGPFGGCSNNDSGRALREYVDAAEVKESTSVVSEEDVGG